MMPAMSNSSEKINLEDYINSFSWNKRIVLLISKTKYIDLINETDLFFKENNLFTDPRNPTINQIAVDSIPEGTVLKDILVAENLYKQYGTSTTNVDKVFFQRLGNVKIKTVDSIPEKYVGDPTSLKTAGAGRTT